MNYKEMIEICNKYEMCCKCPYEIVVLNGDKKVFKCKIKNKV
ncbi:MAG: hypothetical protein ACRDD7_17765 [Peptostreptococcaceae bacterium]